ncbi:hypothetical protein INS49_002296 [Diaporthe citri]|uniref:uncharacterized protein n=1 Tax=Diaporthe citri TaxID=83186 RepID=UPI001C80EA68|nr:uncharacterized protein INS49_002296 [Diaporthe citri]KAG6368096.1 hypothetical protein INS49_002296 [Diaporthe citri]
MNGLLSISERLASNLSPVGRLLVAIIAIALLVRLLVMVVTILRGITHFHITILKILVLWPAWILISILCTPLKLLILVIVVLVWAVRSVARGVMALSILLGLYGGRHLRVESGGSGGKLSPVRRQEANVTSVQDIGMAEFGGHWWRVHVLLPNRPDRGGNNMGFIMGSMDGGAVAWQPTTLGWNGSVAQGSAAQRSITGQGGRTRTQGWL